MAFARATPHRRFVPSVFFVYGMACLSSVLLTIVCYAPAQWLALVIENATDGRVQLQHARGTIWHGSGQWVLSPGPGGRHALALPQRLLWQMHPDWEGGLQWVLHAECCQQNPWIFEISPRLTGWQIRLQANQSHWPLAWLSGLGAPWNTIGLQGQALLHHSHMQLTWESGHWTLTGSAKLTLQDVSSDLSTLKPLGKYELTLEGGEQPLLQLRTLDARLQLQGKGHWQNGHWLFSGEAQASQGHEQVLGNLLGVLGQRQGPKALFQWG
jgi:general secretion pathway protein N